MPIANCIVVPNLKPKADDLVVLWAEASNVSSEQMTVNLMTASEQFGQSYKVMVTLFLPSLWSPSEIKILQTGLLMALTQYFELSEEEVHVMTQIVNSGLVVENGEIQNWTNRS